MVRIKLFSKLLNNTLPRLYHSAAKWRKMSELDYFLDPPERLDEGKLAK